MRLTVETGPLAGTVVHLERETPTLLGSSADCDIRIQETGVIEQHAVVKALKGPGFGIKANGNLRVNGIQVQASPLTDGDIIEIGTTRVAYGQTQESGLPTIAGYRIIDMLGKGGMGTVYRAEQVSLHREVALKVLKQEQTSDAKFIAKFVAEARAAAKLQHPNVVAVFDVERDADKYYYAMELMHDGSCEDWLKQNGIMPIDRALRVIADAAEGLAYAESLDIVHRDIKPDNLMLDQHGAIKIADLGLASTTTSTESTDERAIGTPHFMAPEQVLNKELDHRTDLYALGCTFYRLVTGRTPFRGKTVKEILRAQIKEQPEPASKANPQVPSEVDAIIQKLMAKEPGERYQTANDLIEELEGILQPAQKRGLWIGLAIAAVIFAGGAIYWAVTKPTEKETVVEEKYYDDPQKQEFADRIKVLESEAKQKNASIAFLTTRLSGMGDADMATALDKVAINHPDTSAATEAKDLARNIRGKVAEAAQALAARRKRIADHVTTVRQATIQPLDALDFLLAIRQIDQPAPEDIQSEGLLIEGLSKLRTEIINKAKSRLAELRAPISTALKEDNEEDLGKAIESLDRGIQPATRWPEEVKAELEAAIALCDTARIALANLQAARNAGVWQTYYAKLKEADGFCSYIKQFDFDAASSSIGSFAQAASSKEAADRATAVAAWASNAEAFATALEKACVDGQLELIVDDNAFQIGPWDRTAREFTAKSTGRRRKTQTLSQESLTLEQWLSLAKQVANAPSGSRECFLGLITVNSHCLAAASYLSELKPGLDETGTGDQEYPLTSEVIEEILRTLPRTSDTWRAVLSDELQAGKRLASGLRALSEKRNTAAAGHIEKLLIEHPHSMVVAVLP